MLKKLRNLTYQHAILAVLILAFVLYGIMRGISALFGLLPDSIFADYLKEIITMLYPIGIVILFGFQDVFAFKAKSFLKGLLCALPFILLQVFAFTVLFQDALTNPDKIWKPGYLIILSLVSVLSVSVSEECIYRATFQNILAKKYLNSAKGIWITAIVSALVFGLVHAFNIFAGIAPGAAISQALTNIGIGLFFAALYLRTGNIWVLILVHMLTDTAGLFASNFLMNQNEIEVMSTLSLKSLIGGLIFAGLAVFLLRPSKCKEILASVNEKSYA